MVDVLAHLPVPKKHAGLIVACTGLATVLVATVQPRLQVDALMVQLAQAQQAAGARPVPPQNGQGPATEDPLSGVFEFAKQYEQ